MAKPKRAKREGPGCPVEAPTDEQRRRALAEWIGRDLAGKRDEALRLSRLFRRWTGEIRPKALSGLLFAAAACESLGTEWDAQRRAIRPALARLAALEAAATKASRRKKRGA